MDAIAATASPNARRLGDRTFSRPPVIPCPSPRAVRRYAFLHANQRRSVAHADPRQADPQGHAARS
jgi:hypothetical protein